MELKDRINGAVARRSLLCLWLCISWVAPSAHALILETESNDIFFDLDDVNNNFDFSRAMVGSNDTFRAAIGVAPSIPTLQEIIAGGSGILNANDIDWWNFDLHIGTIFKASLVEIPGPIIGLYKPSAILYMENDGRLIPVSGNGDLTNLQSSLTFAPWEDGNYFLGVSGGNNHPINAASANLQQEIRYANALIPTVSPLASFSGEGGSTFVYDLELQGTFAPTANASTVPIPSALWLFITGLLALAGVVRQKSD